MSTKTTRTQLHKAARFNFAAFFGEFTLFPLFGEGPHDHDREGNLSL